MCLRGDFFCKDMLPKSPNKNHNVLWLSLTYFLLLIVCFLYTVVIFKYFRAPLRQNPFFKNVQSVCLNIHLGNGC